MKKEDKKELDCRKCKSFVYCDFGKQYISTILGRCDDFEGANQ
jgi:hypothetical protein